MKLLIAGPSPYARKVRVALREKGIGHEEVLDLPWNPGSAAGRLNPLGKVPVLVDGDEVVWESSVILEYLETLGRGPALIPGDAAGRLAVRRVEALADGICDAVMLSVLETKRPAAKRSSDWLVRQRVKVVEGVAALEAMLGEREWFVGEALTVADIAAGAALGYVSFRMPEVLWRRVHFDLHEFSKRMEARPSFAATKPADQEIAALG
jgi:glutathione S-transferase